jgi:beta-glucanase (GH16 family)
LYQQKRGRLIILILAATFAQLFANGLAYASTPSQANDKLVWDDEFNGRAGSLPDQNRWGVYVGGSGWGNSQLEYDTNNKNVYLNGHGQLVLEARKENPAHYQCWYGSCQYTSARINTKINAHFTYGRFEARIKMPSGQGIWPAFWLLGSNIATGVSWPTCGEIDGMENIGREPATIHGTVHGPGYGLIGIGKPYTLAHGRFSDAYHIFAVQWDSAYIRFFVDGKNYFTIDHTIVARYGKWVFDHPFFIMLDNEVGGLWPGSPNSATVFPQKMLVDYVRVYQ